MVYLMVVELTADLPLRGLVSGRGLGCQFFRWFEYAYLKNRHIVFYCNIGTLNLVYFN